MRALLALFALFAAFACQPLCAAPIPGGPDILAARAADALAAMAGRKPAAEVFTADFLKAIPARQLARLSADLRRANGKAAGFDGLTVIAPTVARFRIRFERATAQASIQLEPWAPHRIAAFSISAVTPLGDSAEKILADFAALPARSGFAVVKLGDGGISPVLTLRPAGHLAIGSAFKLWVLDALAGEIEAGRLRWEQVVPLGPPSLPSGVTQNWPRTLQRPSIPSPL